MKNKLPRYGGDIMSRTYGANQDFKVVGYYPCWVPDQLEKVDFSVLTHVNYAFAIPTAEGTLLPLRNPETARKLVAAAHENGAKAMIVVGGWDYQDVLLEHTFELATDTPSKRKNLADEIIALCLSFDFDGVDVDWEHPRVGTPSAGQYEDLMLDLSRRLHEKGKLLTSAVTSGATYEGDILYDAAAQSDRVLGACDWINVMAYDAVMEGDHSSYEFAVNCSQYWKNQRGLPADKVVLGLPFYARVRGGAYGEILNRVPDAYQKDLAILDGEKAYYNGIPTIQKKTAYAKENLGGVMIWELTQDSLDKKKSLLTAIGGIAN